MTVQWWVIFRELERPCWWRRLVRPGFAHCLVLTAIPGDGGTVAINPRTQDLEIAFSPLSPWRVLRSLREDGQTVITLERPSFTDGAMPLVPFPTCATLCAYALGVHRRVWTPWQLYKLLTRRYGARDLAQSWMGECDGQSG